MPQRFQYDLSHYSMMVGDMGRLQTQSVIPIVAGDSISVNFEGVFRLSPLRRNIILDSMVDMFAFYVPHRHAYGDLWNEFIKQGVDETVTFPTFNPTHSIFCMGNEFHDGYNMPKWLPHAYVSIWNRYFRHPTTAELDPTNNTTLTNFFDGETSVKGRLCAWPKAPWNTPMPDVSGADREVSVSSNKFDIIDLHRVQGRYKTELDRNYFGQRYNDILERTWDSSVNIDADERPELVMRETRTLSGYSVDATADNIGQYIGRSEGVVKFGFPRKYFPEHGSLWIMSLLRFPLIVYSVQTPATSQPQPDYKRHAGDPDVIMSEPPETLIRGEWLGDNPNTAFNSQLVVPYAQHYRFQPSVVHERYQNQLGYPFLTPSQAGMWSSDQNRVYYIYDGAHDGMFQNTQLFHWNSQSRVGVEAARVIPPATASIYAGTRR